MVSRVRRFANQKTGVDWKGRRRVGGEKERADGKAGGGAVK